jgi:hypothetical protein
LAERKAARHRSSGRNHLDRNLFSLLLPKAPVQVTASIVGVSGTEIRQGDGAAVEAEAVLMFEAETKADILLIDLP